MTDTDIHSCGYYCDKPACIKAQRDELRDDLFLSKPTPEPVAYLCENAVGHKYFRWKKPQSVFKPIALYTAPPQREWVGLTDDEMLDIYAQDHEGKKYNRGRLVEAKLKEKNG
jgi:hypothetical protein